MVSTVIWGTGNVGRAAIRAVEAHPGLELAAVLVHDPAKAGRDAGPLSGLGHDLGVAATTDVDAVLAARPRAVVYAASGDIRPDDALADVLRAVAGAVVVTPSLYALYDQRNAPPELRARVLAAIEEGGGSLFVSGVDPGWGNDVLPLLISGLGATVDVVRCQEIFDYTAYDQPDSVRDLVGMGRPMDYEPPMIAPTVPTMVWGGQVRLMARAPAGGDGAHRVIIEGSPRIEVTVEATDEGGNRAAGGNATAAGRLVNAIDWLAAAEPGLYDALDVPLRPATGRLGRKRP